MLQRYEKKVKTNSFDKKCIYDIIFTIIHEPLPLFCCFTIS